jgi:hypothetical protein
MTSKCSTTDLFNCFEMHSNTVTHSASAAVKLRYDQQIIHSQTEPLTAWISDIFLSEQLAAWHPGSHLTTPQHDTSQ